MFRQLNVSAVALAVAAGWALPAHAQSSDAAIQQELAAMRAQMATMAQRIDTLESQLVDARAKADAAQQAAAAVIAPSVTGKPPVEVTWDGGPKLATKDGWSFKPRGRLQIDVAGVDAPRGVPNAQQLGIGTEFRRAYIGFDGTMPGGFGYRIEAELANSAVELTDVYLAWKATPEITLTAGQHKPFWGMEEMTSDLFTSFMERAQVNSAFGYERRVGLSGAYAGKTFLVQGGVFTDNAADLNNDRNNSVSFDGRVVFMPRFGDAQLHIGGSAHYRKFNDLTNQNRYRARPFVHTTDLRLIDTNNQTVDRERILGAEAALILGRFHAAAEGMWMKARRPGASDLSFDGGYAEVGMLLTDDVTAYKGGTFDRIKPKNPVTKGGIGAILVNARYDWVDLRSPGVIGGKQQTAGVSLIWMPTDYVRFLVNYGHLWLTDAAVPAIADRDYSADVLGMRAQFDF